MTDKQPDPLRLADALEFHGRYGYEDEQEAATRRVQRNAQAAALLRTQHAAIERKDALLKQALKALLEHGSAYLHHEPQYEAAIGAITKELQ